MLRGRAACLFRLFVLSLECKYSMQSMSKTFHSCTPGWSGHAWHTLTCAGICEPSRQSSRLQVHPAKSRGELYSKKHVMTSQRHRHHTTRIHCSHSPTSPNPLPPPHHCSVCNTPHRKATPNACPKLPHRSLQVATCHDGIHSNDICGVT